MSQGDIEHRTGLLRCYISRVENGHTIPAVETLENLARALEVPLFHLFYEGEKPPAPNPPAAKSNGWGSSGTEARLFDKFRRVLARTNEEDRKLLFVLAGQMSRRKAHPRRGGKKAS